MSDRTLRIRRYVLAVLGSAAAAFADEPTPPFGPTGQTVVVTVRVPAYSVAPPHVFRGFFPPGARLEVVGPSEPGFLRVRFASADGHHIEGLCRVEHLAPTLAQAQKQEAGGTAATPGTAYKERAWLEDAAGYKEAVRLQSQFEAPMLLFFYADWNPESQLADRELLDTTEFKNKTKHIIKVRINPEHGEEEGRLAAKLGVYSFPTTLVVDKPHAPPRRIRLVRKVFGRFRADDVEHALAKIMAGTTHTPPTTNAPPPAATNEQNQVPE